MIPADTDPAIFDIQLNIWRNMEPSQKFDQVANLCDDSRALVVAGIHNRHPEYTSDQVKHASFRIFLGEDLYRKVWPNRTLLPS